jgi:NAD(P)-dependent dehydrogenase (short-subunit alcohol dehydrogenase family)
VAPLAATALVSQLPASCPRFAQIGFSIRLLLTTLPSLGEPISTFPFRWSANCVAVRVEHADADLQGPDAPESLVRSAVTAFGYVDILIVNHAYSTLGSLEELTAEEIDRHLHVNVRVSLLLTKAFGVQHDKHPGGRIVLRTSGQHLGPMPGELAYVAS